MIAEQYGGQRNLLAERKENGAYAAVFCGPQDIVSAVILNRKSDPLAIELTRGVVTF